MSDERPRTDRPEIPDDGIDSLTEHDRNVNAALIDELSDGDGDGVESFDRADWTHYAKAVLEYRGVDPENVAILVGDDGVEIVPMDELLEQREAIASMAELASRYLRRVERVDPDEIAGRSDTEIVMRFLERTDLVTGGDE